MRKDVAGVLTHMPVPSHTRSAVDVAAQAENNPRRTMPTRTSQTLKLKLLPGTRINAGTRKFKRAKHFMESSSGMGRTGAPDRGRRGHARGAAQRKRGRK